jgi:flagellar hook-basal body complex protein FliE
MDLRLTPNTMPTSGVRPGMGARPAASSGQAVQGFADQLKTALQSVSKVQNDAEALQQRVQMDDPKVSLEQTMVAIQKAQIGFQATLNVRNRMVQAYSDIMNMQV